MFKRLDGKVVRQSVFVCQTILTKKRRHHHKKEEHDKKVRRELLLLLFLVFVVLLFVIVESLSLNSFATRGRQSGKVGKGDLRSRTG